MANSDVVGRSGNRPEHGLSRVLSGQLTTYVLVALTVLGCASRFVFLDADPGVFKHVGDVGDEGYWAFAARNFALYGQFRTDEYVQAAVGPLYALLGVPVYWLTPVSVWSSRILPGVFLILTVVLTYRMLRPLGAKPALLAAAVLSVDHKLFIYSRIGHTDIAAAFLGLLAYWGLLNKRTYLAGVFFGIAVATKFTAFLMAGGLALALWWLWLRGDLSTRQIMRFVAGAATVGVALGMWMFVYSDILAPTYRMQAARGVAIVTAPDRLVADFFLTPTFGYPSMAMLLILASLYLHRVNVVGLLTFRPAAMLSQLRPIDIVVLSWLIGYSIALIAASDMNNRRFNYLSIPLAFVPALLLSMPAGTALRRRFSERAAAWAPLFILMILVGRPVLQRWLEPGAAFLLSSLAGAATIFALASKPAWSGVWRLIVIASKRGAWVAVASLALLNMLWILVLPQLGVTSLLARAAVVLGILGAVWVFAEASRRRLPAALAGLVLVNVVLVGFELSCRSYSIRDSSRQLAAIVAPDDYVVGALAFQLSFEGRFHPFLWWPEFGINTASAGRVRPRFLIRADNEPSGKPRTPDEPAFFSAEPRDSELEAIGVRERMPLARFELYPVRGRPRARYTVYELRY